MNTLGSRGMSLLTVLVVGMIVAIVATGSLTLLKTGFRAGTHSKLQEQTEALRETFALELDCQQSLGVTPATALPLNCGAWGLGALPLRRRDGSTIVPAGGGNLGQWSVRASCNGNGIQIEVRRQAPAGSIPMMDGMIESYYRWTDLFRGTRRFCQTYFGSSPCTGIYNYYQGRRKSGAICCRFVAVGQPAFGGGAPAQCNNDEYSPYGGSGCWGFTPNGFITGQGPYSRVPGGNTVVTGNHDPLGGPDFTAYVPPNPAVTPVGHETECHPWNGYPGGGAAPADTLATSLAVCCPRG